MHHTQDFSMMGYKVPKNLKHIYNYAHKNLLSRDQYTTQRIAMRRFRYQVEFLSITHIGLYVNKQ